MSTIDIETEITGKVWKILVKQGDKVEEDQPIMILESMKMEIPVPAPENGTIAEILVEEDEAVEEGQAVAILDEE